MVTFDVTSIFASTPQDLAIETIRLLLQSKYDETENHLGDAQVLQLLKLCLWTYFTFDRTIYEQVKDTPMRSPISEFLAEAVLQRLDSLVFQHHRLKFWTRYVDDTFVDIERDQLLTFKTRLNAVFPDIKFTMEEGKNNQLAFLDVHVCRKDCGGLKTNVFRKATHMTQVLNFNSNHPISHKITCYGLTIGVSKRTAVSRKTRLPNYNISDGSSKPMATSATSSTGASAKGTKGLTAWPLNFGERFYMSRTFRKLLAAFSHHLVLELHKDRRQPSGVLVMKPKDPLPRQETSGVAYRIWCSCGQSNYVGETGRQLQTRMAEQAAAVRINDAPHSTGSGHTFKFDEAKLLARGDSRVSRQLLESWFTVPQSIKKCNDLPLQCSVLNLHLGGVIGHAGSALVNTVFKARVGGSDGRAIITPASNACDEIAARNDANVGRQAIRTPRATTPEQGRRREY
nr:unnamed protein product [Spirometra erinaceieuropaei]